MSKRQSYRQEKEGHSKIHQQRFTRLFAKYFLESKILKGNNTFWIHLTNNYLSKFKNFLPISLKLIEFALTPEKQHRLVITQDK
jgi:hypothetical protein